MREMNVQVTVEARGTGSPGAGFAGGSELPDVDAGN